MIGRAWGLRSLVAGDEVAILSNSRPQKVRGVGLVEFVGPTMITLEDGKVFLTEDGQSVDHTSHIVPAKEEHWDAMLAETNTKLARIIGTEARFSIPPLCN